MPWYVIVFIVGLPLLLLGNALGGAAPKAEGAKVKNNKRHPHLRAISDDDDWDDIPFNKPTHHNGWAILPRSHNSKLVTISYIAEQQKARDDIVRAILERAGVALAARRDPKNRYDGNAIAIFGIINGAETEQAGYVDAKTAELLAQKYRPEMPINAEIRSVRSNGQQVYIGVNLLVPIKKIRASFEIT